MKEKLNSLISSLNNMYEIKYSINISNEILNKCNTKDDLKMAKNRAIIEDFKNVLNELNELSNFITDTFKQELNI